MKAAGFSDMLVTTYETTRHIQEDRNLELKN
jgi:hypothetical protein